MSKNTNKELHENVNFRSVAEPATYKGPTVRIQSVQIVCCYQLKMGATLRAIVVVIAFIVMQKPLP